jgi:benzoyl-CoA reductase/2-hydroxyglutaryl-CoA dehydratase subunit BcrC/BadD/HgdB
MGGYTMSKDLTLHDKRTLDNHKESINNVINSIKSLNFPAKNIDYFLGISENCMLSNSNSRRQSSETRIAILGLNFPEEIIYACGATPIWAIGGSHSSGQYADQFVPRDTDPVTRSTYGYMKNELFIPSKDIDLAIIPITSDNMRKIASLLSKEIEIFPIDIPPNHDDIYFEEKIMDQFKSLISIISKKTNKSISIEKLNTCTYTVNLSKYQLHRFIINSTKLADLVSSTLFLTIINSYFLAPSITDWINNMNDLNHELEILINRMHRSKKDSYIEQYSPNILLTGSPIYFPNMKIPTLLDDLNISLPLIDFEMTNRIFDRPEFRKQSSDLNTLLRNIILHHYKNDCSTSFILNNKRMDIIKKLALSRQIDGVLYHVLKGHVCYDFELDMIENFFMNLDIPLIRVETDYNTQDVEQLRIRMEAFNEMLTNINTNIKRKII